MFASITDSSSKQATQWLQTCLPRRNDTLVCRVTDTRAQHLLIAAFKLKRVRDNLIEHLCTLALKVPTPSDNNSAPALKHEGACTWQLCYRTHVKQEAGLQHKTCLAPVSSSPG